jgi:hypothetical protein
MKRMQLLVRVLCLGAIGATASCQHLEPRSTLRELECSANDSRPSTQVVINVGLSGNSPTLSTENCEVAAGQKLIWRGESVVDLLEVEFTRETPDENGGLHFRKARGHGRPPEIWLKVRANETGADIAHKYTVSANGYSRDPAIIIKPD